MSMELQRWSAGFKEDILKCDEECSGGGYEKTNGSDDPGKLGPGDSRSNGAAERAVKALGEHVRNRGCDW